VQPSWSCTDGQTISQSHSTITRLWNVIYLVVLAQVQTENRIPLFLKLL
jgi:hypothetical protein